MSDTTPPTFPREITRYYQEVAEEGRLATGASQLELARTKEIVLRSLPLPPAKTRAELDSSLDCGCGSKPDTVEDTIMKRLFATVLALSVLALGSGARLIAHEGHEHKVMGTVTMAAADHVMLKDKDGKDVIVKVTKDTKIKAKPAVKVEDIKVGSRIVVTAVEEKDKSMTAKSIEVGALAAATK
jgi:hypothetical protein